MYQLHFTISYSWGYFMSHWPDISTTIALLAIGIITWTLAWILMPMVWTIDSVPTRMTCLFVGAQICGIFLRILQWPEMLGMLGFGVVFANIGFANFDGYNGVEVFCRWVVRIHFSLSLTHCCRLVNASNNGVLCFVLLFVRTAIVFHSAIVISSLLSLQWLGTGKYNVTGWHGYRPESVDSTNMEGGIIIGGAYHWRGAYYSAYSRIRTTNAFTLEHFTWVGKIIYLLWPLPHIGKVKHFAHDKVFQHKILF